MDLLAIDTGPAEIIGHSPQITSLRVQIAHVASLDTPVLITAPGWLAEARSGTLMLQDIQALPGLQQPQLLRALRERVCRRIGDAQPSGFSGELWRALSVDRIHVPALREHAEDIPPLAQYFLARYARCGEGVDGRRDRQADAWARGN